jgi:hypothetical protein
MAPGVVMDFHTISNPVVNASGEVAFLGAVSDPETSEGARALFAPDANGELTTALLEPVPGMPPGTEFLHTDYYPRLDDSGAVAFRGVLTGPEIDPPPVASGIWRWHAQTGLEVVVRAGDAVPGAAAGSAFGFDGLLTFPTIGPDGAIGFFAWFGSPESPYDALGNFVADENGIAVIGATGTPVAGVPGAAMTQVYEAVGNLLGQWAFSAWLAGPGVIENQNDFASFFWDPVAGLSMGLRRGDPAPQMPQGVVLSSVASYLGDAGRLAYVVSLAGPGVNDANDTALYATNASGAVVLLATEGGPAPGTEPGTVFSDFQVMSNSVVVNAAGQVAFAGGLVGPAITPANGFGIWVSDPATSALALRVRQGDPAPELPGLTLSELWAPILNNRGDLVFKSMLEGPGATYGTDMGIFALERGITPVKVVRAGDLVSFGPGDMRALRSFSMLDGRISDAPGIGQLSDNGHIVFIARAWDADAIVVAQLPEPQRGMGLFLGIAAITALRRREQGGQAPCV